MNYDGPFPFFRGRRQPEACDEIKISLASPEKILSWSYGEVKKPETINYRSFKPERDGLFCAKIFGPTKDFECLCGKYKRMKNRGITCEKCGVEVIEQSARRERMGHITLAAPVAHIWFLKLLPSRIGTLLDMKLKDVESVLYFDRYVVIDNGFTDLEVGHLLDERQLQEAIDDYGEQEFKAGTGAEAIRTMLESINLEELEEDLREKLTSTKSQQTRKDIKKRLKLVMDFLGSGNRPEWMVLKILPVIPPELRPLVPLDGGRFATSDLNDLYRRVINRNNRLKKLIELNAPDIILRNEKRMLQESVDALFDNGRRGKVITNATNKRPLKSLSHMLKGKQGRFRQNLLGKRVDFSGRTVIVTGPELKLHQCGLPKKMAKELFKPFIISKLQQRGLSTTVKHAKREVEKESTVVWDILDEVIREHPVLLNRAPTLHRLGIQAFEPVLIEGKALQLHPLVCSAFNADFDGDQMAVHVPLSLDAQLESRVLMMSTNNVLSPANGVPIIVPSQDMVLGLYYISLMRDGMPGEGRRFTSVEEVEHALAAGVVHRHAKVQFRIDAAKYPNVEGQDRWKETTPGRILLSDHLPANEKIPYDLINRELRKREVQEIIDTVHRHCGQKESVIFCDHIMEIGFRESCNAGISFSKNDMLVPDRKQQIVDQTRERVAGFTDDANRALMSESERYKKTVDAWAQCTDDIQKLMESAIESRHLDDGIEQERNSIYMMTHSGARGSRDQMKQLAGMRGLIAKGTGDIIETPIVSNFKEGLNVAEYFNSAHGSRKGLADTALKTANAGYLTRRLVDVAQDCIVRSEDCGTREGITITSIVTDGDVLVDIAERIEGRVPAEDILDPVSGETIAPRGVMIDGPLAADISRRGVQRVMLRSPVTCEAEDGICGQCYGRDLARGTKVNVGEAVGIVAAQSIGEPGTQLTMRTFHIGGIAQQSGDKSFVQASYAGRVQFEDAQTLDDARGRAIVVSRSMRINLVDSQDRLLFTHKVPYGSTLLVADGAAIERGHRMFEWDPYATSVYAEKGGLIRHIDLIQGTTVSEHTNEEAGFTEKVVNTQGGGRKPDRLIPTSQASNRSDVSGRAWFENAELAHNSTGKLVAIGDDMQIVIVNEHGQEVVAHQIPTRAVLKVANGQLVAIGDLLYDYADGDSDLTPVVRQGGDAGTKAFDWRNRDILKPSIIIVDEVTGDPVCMDSGNPLIHELAIDATIRIKEGAAIQPGDEIVRFPVRTTKTRDITGGLPRVADLFEARTPKDLAVMTEVDGIVEFGREYKTTRVVNIVKHKDGESTVLKTYRVPNGIHLPVQEGDAVRRGDLLVEGTPSPQNVLESKGIDALADFMINEVQHVYLLQGVRINDKHIEVILRQMLQKERVTDPGDTVFFDEQRVDRTELEETNKAAREHGLREAHSVPVILGISKAALGTSSFISAASFQETTRVLTDAAVKGRVDRLKGLKESVIVGKLIPAGTGRAASEFKRLAAERDEVIRLEKEKERLALVGSFDEGSLADIDEDIPDISEELAALDSNDSDAGIAGPEGDSAFAVGEKPPAEAALEGRAAVEGSDDRANFENGASIAETLGVTDDSAIATEDT